jgi:hypothetical protein
MSTAIATKVEPTAVAAPNVVNAESLFGAIMRATEGGVDLDKVERMMGLYERVKANEAKAAWIAAMSAAQPELPVIRERGKNTGTNSRYALWEDVNAAITPVLARHGITLTFRTNIAEKMATVTAVVAHAAGHSEETTVPVPVEQVNRAMNSAQAVGSAISYGKRYAAGAILNFTSTGEDDDGARAGAGVTITAAQYEQLTTWLDEVDGDADKFAAVLKVDSLHSLTVARWNDAVRKLQARAADLGRTLSQEGRNHAG